MFAKLLTASAALLVATPAMARPPSTLHVDNHWEASVQVHVDGYRIGTLGGFDSGSFRMRSGYHTVEVRSMNGTVLDRDSRWFLPHHRARIDVATPITTLTVTNKGATPLFISGVEGGFWLDPGRTETAPVPAGQMHLTASVRGRHGSLHTIDTRSFWAEPGARNRTAFAHIPAPTRLVLHNTERFPVLVTVDGRSHGMLAPGGRLALDVRPGRHEVDAWTRHGRRVFDGTVLAGRGSDTRVALDVPEARPPRDRTYASAGHRGHRGHRGDRR